MTTFGNGKWEMGNGATIFPSPAIGRKVGGERYSDRQHRHSDRSGGISRSVLAGVSLETRPVPNERSLDQTRDDDGFDRGITLTPASSLDRGRGEGRSISFAFCLLPIALCHSLRAGLDPIGIEARAGADPVARYRSREVTIGEENQG